MLIELKDIYKIYQTGDSEVRALNGVSLSVSQGEFVAVIGSSGSGKSTLMNMLGCLDIPTSGRYCLDGKDVSEMDDNALSDIRNKKIGFIFQSFNLIPSLNALENVELPLIYRRIGKAERRELAEEALRRVGLARAIAARPPILLADEPTGNLDSQSGAEIVRILHELHQEGKTVILITHDHTLAQTAGRIIQIADGKIARTA